MMSAQNEPTRTRRRGRQVDGSRYLYEPFDSAHARVETLERVIEERWIALERTLTQIETAMERLERRLWLALFSFAAALTGQFAALLFRIFEQ